MPNASTKLELISTLKLTRSQHFGIFLKEVSECIKETFDKSEIEVLINHLKK